MINTNTTNLEAVLAAVQALPEAGGGEIPDNYHDTSAVTAAAGDVVTGKKIVDANGAVVDGTNPYELTSTNTEVAEQADLITQIQTALEGKAAGGGGGASVQTCSIRIVCTQASIYGYTYLAYRDGAFVPVCYSANGDRFSLDVTLTDVICGGYVYVQTDILSGMISLSAAGDATVEKQLVMGSKQVVVFIKAPSAAGSESTVTIVDID